MKYDLNLLDDYVAQGLLRKAEDEDLVQYNYSEKILVAVRHVTGDIADVKVYKKSKKKKTAFTVFLSPYTIAYMKAGS